MNKLLNVIALAGSWGMTGTTVLVSDVQSVVGVISALAAAILTISLAFKNWAEAQKILSERNRNNAEAEQMKKKNEA